MIQDLLPKVDPELARQYAESTSGMFMGIPLFESNSVLQLIIRFGLNMLVIWLIVHFFYYRKSRRRDFYFTYIIFSLSMFLLVFLLENVKLEVGMALGLFAIFGMMRYRTESVPIREMTYLFMTVALSVINGMALAVSITELILTNALFVLGAFVMEHVRLFRNTATKVILYDNIQLITPRKYEEMLSDLRQRTGLPIERAEIGFIDYIKDAAYVKIYYSAPDGQDMTFLASGALGRREKESV